MGLVLVVALVVVGVVAYTGGGNTVEGFGRDLERSGDKVQRAVD